MLVGVGGVLVLVGVNPAQCVSHVKTQRGENTTSGCPTNAI